jgi:hypothetical protein
MDKWEEWYKFGYLDINDISWYLSRNKLIFPIWIADKVRLMYNDLIRRKYWLSKKEYEKITKIHNNMEKYINGMDRNDWKKFIEHAEDFYIWLYWNTKEWWRYAYWKFLWGLVRDHERRLKEDVELQRYIEEKMRRLLKDRSRAHEYRLGFYIDIMRWWRGEKLDNKECNDRYEYWEKYKDKG